MADNQQQQDPALALPNPAPQQNQPPPAQHLMQHEMEQIVAFQNRSAVSQNISIGMTEADSRYVEPDSLRTYHVPDTVRSSTGISPS